MARIGGTCYFKIDGQQLSLTGGIEVPMNRTVNDDIIGLDGSVDRKETHRAPYVKGTFKVPKNFPVSKITSSDEMTKKPSTAHGETLSVLEFDEPTGKDVRELGYPYQMNQDESVRLLAHVVSKYIVRLAKVPQSSVDQMSPADLNAAAWLVAGFFLQA